LRGLGQPLLDEATGQSELQVDTSSAGNELDALRIDQEGADSAAFRARIGRGIGATAP
jgi:hypothetical protein